MSISADRGTVADLLFLKDQSCADALTMMMADVALGCSELYVAAEAPLHVVLVESMLPGDPPLWRYRIMLVSLNDAVPTEVRVAGYCRLVPSGNSLPELEARDTYGLAWKDSHHVDSADPNSALQAFLRALPLAARLVRSDARAINVFWSQLLEAVATALDSTESRELNLVAYCLNPQECEMRGLHRPGPVLGGRGA